MFIVWLRKILSRIAFFSKTRNLSQSRMMKDLENFTYKHVLDKTLSRTHFVIFFRNLSHYMFAIIFFKVFLKFHFMDNMFAIIVTKMKFAKMVLMYIFEIMALSFRIHVTLLWLLVVVKCDVIMNSEYQLCLDVWLCIMWLISWFNMINVV